MEEAETISAANRFHAKKRWAKASAEQRHVNGRRVIEASAPVVTESRSQETRLAQVFGTKTPEVAEAKRLENLHAGCQADGHTVEDWPTGYFGREL